MCRDSGLTLYWNNNIFSRLPIGQLFFGGICKKMLAPHCALLELMVSGAKVLVVLMYRYNKTN